MFCLQSHQYLLSCSYIPDHILSTSLLDYQVPLSNPPISPSIRPISSPSHSFRLAKSLIPFSPAFPYNSNARLARPSRSLNRASLLPCPSLKFFNAATNGVGGGCVCVCMRAWRPKTVARACRSSAFDFEERARAPCWVDSRMWMAVERRRRCVVRRVWVVFDRSIF